MATINIKDINLDCVEDLTNDSFINLIFGGRPTPDTSLAYDISYYVGSSARWVSDKVGSGARWVQGKVKSAWNWVCN